MLLHIGLVHVYRQHSSNKSFSIIGETTKNGATHQIYIQKKVGKSTYYDGKINGLTPTLYLKLSRFLMFKEINLRNHSSLHKRFDSFSISTKIATLI